VDPIGLKPGMKVLDIGCGTGGSAFYMASYFGAEGTYFNANFKIYGMN